MKRRTPASPTAPKHGLAVLGAHGGAGMSTVVRLLDPQGQGWAVELSPGQHLPHNYIPVVVTRSTAYGLHRTQDLLNRWHPSIPRPWLVVIRDAPLRPPLPVRYRLRTVAPRTLGIAHVPYLYRLRLVDDPAEALTDTPVSKAGRELRASLGFSD